MEDEFTLGDLHRLDDLMAGIEGDAVWNQMAACQADTPLPVHMPSF